MKAYWIFGIAMAGLSAHAQDCAVTVYVRTDLLPPTGMLSRAEAKTTAIFHDIGVPVLWRAGAPPAATPTGSCGARLVIRIEVSEHVQASPEALAFATPFNDSGTCIHVLLDRVFRTSTGSLAPVVLGYVMSHEIAHVLQRVDWHSREGIMKAHWDRRDYWRMGNGSLVFSPEDVELIHNGLASRLLHAAVE